MVDIYRSNSKSRSTATGGESLNGDSGVQEQIPIEGWSHEGTPINQSALATVTLSPVSRLPIKDIPLLLDEQPDSRRLDKLI